MAEKKKNQNASENEKEAKVSKQGKETKPAKQKKPGIFSKLLKLFKESKNEVKKVTWAGKKATTKNTILVIVSLVIVAIIFGVFDWLFRIIVDFIMDLY